ncbi:methyltransferase domain-containing protein [Candidatus Peregrinibacteria bacterium]|jgi:ubiquinone/menaquinone biosynthesis C-methylase UbiE|nr:methyltransferase domain-containing protein [Candidatus Peregrinibacteria bacterium]MBT4056427.1 methyltransferase domain-containing protein [Candidatus Peregrinibacteria bacterium]
MRSKTAKALLKNVKKTYNHIADDFSKTRQNIWEEFKIFNKYIKDGDKIADIGCGNGRFYKFISKTKEIKYIGIDNSQKLIAEAKKISTRLFKTGDLLKIPLKDNSKNVTLSIAVLHHIPSKQLRQKAIKELARVTKKGGKLLLTVWNLREQKKYKTYVRKAFIRWLTTLGKYEKRGLLIPWGLKKLPRYYYAFKPREVEKLLETHFKIIHKRKGKNLIYICEKK